jgi:hypothetical protein
MQKRSLNAVVMMLAFGLGCATMGIGVARANAPIAVQILFEGGYAWAFSEHESRVDVGSVSLPTPHPPDEHEHPLRLAICEGSAESTIIGTAPLAGLDGWFPLADWRTSVELGMTPQLQQEGWRDVLDVSAEHNRSAASVDHVFNGYIRLMSGIARVTPPKATSLITRADGTYETRKAATEVVWADEYNDDHFYLHFAGLHGNEGKWGAFRVLPDPQTHRVTIIVSPGRVLAKPAWPNQTLTHFNMFYRVLGGPAVPSQLRLRPHCAGDCDNEPKDCSNFRKNPGDSCPIARFSL